MKKMHHQLRKFLEKNGLSVDASVDDAWEFHRSLVQDGVAYNGPEVAEEEPKAAHRDGGERTDPDQILSMVTEEDLQRKATEAARAEQDRIEQVREVCLWAKISEEKVREFVRSGASLDKVREFALKHLQENNAPLGASGASVGVEDRDKFRAAAVDGVLMQAGVRKEKQAPGAGDFKAASPLDLARQCLERSGVNTSMMSKSQIAQRALIPHSTSDFPMLLGGIGRESLLAGYTEAPQTWKPLASRGTATDFRDMYTYAFNGAFELRPVKENGEYETVEASESGEKYRIARRGAVFPYTFEMAVNDNWGVLTTLTRRFGAAAMRMESKIFYDLLTGNSAMSDGQALFSAAHANLLTGAVLSAESLEEAISTLWLTTGADGEPLDLQPGYLLVHPADYFTAQVLMGSTSSLKNGENAGVMNPLAGIVQIIADPRIAAGSWYLFAAPSQAPVIEVAWLDGEESPFIDEQVDFITDGIQIKARHCFGAGKISFRGAIFNPGE